MTTPELITDEIVERTRQKLCYKFQTYISHENTRDILMAIQDDITRPVYALLNGWKQNSEAYERALKDIRLNGDDLSQEIADAALKGDYHKTDFTEFCEKNPMEDK